MDNDINLETSTKSIQYGSHFELPILYKFGYRFLGWFDADNTQYTDVEGDSILCWDKSEDSTLYACWEIIEYNITYELNGGLYNEENPLKYTIEDGIIVLNEPTKEGHWFLGWKDEEGNDVYYIETSITRDLVLIAVWL